MTNPVGKRAKMDGSFICVAQCQFRKKQFYNTN